MTETQRKTAPLRLPLALLLALGACTAGPNFAPPSPAAADRYAAPAETVQPDTGQRFAYGAQLQSDWWSLFHAPGIDAAIREALASNHSLAAAEASLAAANEAVATAQGGTLPQVNGSASLSREEVNLATAGFKGKNPNINLYSVGGTVSFDLDLAGGRRRRIESLAARAESARQRERAAALALTGNVVRQALVIAAANAEMDAVADILAGDERNVALTRTAREAGATTALDVLAAESQLANDRTLLPPLRQQASLARHALAVYVGQPPGAYAAPELNMARLDLPPELPVRLPAALVHERPDILAAEANLHEATAAIGVAEAQLYPQVDLMGAIAQGALQPGKIFSGAFTGWSLGPAVSLPIFNGGTLEANKRAAEDEARAALETYRQTVLGAFGEVADVLQALVHDAQAVAEQKRALDTAASALRLARASFAEGNVGILRVLDSQRQFQQARLGYVRALSARYLDSAQLLVATAAGWEGK